MKFSKPSFCIITPTSYLDYALYSNVHLVLAHLVDTNSTYAEFYKERSDHGDYIMMDNSAYELKEPFSPDKLLTLANQCGANAIVLPDYPFKPAQVTIDAAEKFAPIFKDAGYETFFVPQSERGNLDDWLHAYEWATNNDMIDIIGMSILGIPNAIPAVDPSFARVVMSQILIERGLFNFEKHHHYLGLNAGPALEIPSLIRMNVLDTIDSSGPVWAGILGHGYTTDADSYQQSSKLKMPVAFECDRTKDQATHDRILHNIKLTVGLFDESTLSKERVWYADE